MSEKNTKKNKNEKQDQLAACEKEKEEYLNGWRRAAADLENYKRDEAKRLTESGNYLRRSIFKDFLPILDSLDRALEAHSKEENDGLALVKNQFLQILENNGIKPIKAKKGDDFDHNLHNAVSEMSTEEGALVGKVMEVVSTGYELEGKVIRATKVVIGSMKNEE